MDTVEVYSVWFQGRLRMSSLSNRECEVYATDLYNDRKVNPQRLIPEIYVDTCVPKDHRRRATIGK